MGRGSELFHPRWLHNWQLFWLQALRLHGPDADYELQIGNATYIHTVHTYIHIYTYVCMYVCM